MADAKSAVDFADRHLSGHGVPSAMCTAKLTLLVVASAVAAGLTGTEVSVAAGQDGGPADAGKPDPEWNRDPEGFDRAEWSKYYLDMLKLREDHPARPKPPTDRDRVRPTAFPDVKPVGPKELREFVDKRVSPVLETDPPLRKLLKAKLRTATDELLFLGSLRYGAGDPREPFEHTAAAMVQAVREAVAVAVELAEGPEDRRAWLEFRVRLEKEHEAFSAERISQGLALPSGVMSARRHRLDAEIALMKHAARPGGAAGTGAGKPDPEWNKAPDWDQQVEPPREAGPPQPPPPDWGRVRPTAFPDVKPVGPKELREFAAKRVPPVLDSDPPLRKLQKAKLRVAMKELASLIEFKNVGDPKASFVAIMSELAQAVREAVATGVELADRPEDRRAWLEFRVGVEKEYEAIVAERVKMGLGSPVGVLSTRRHRLEAELALLRHIQESAGKAK